MNLFSTLLRDECGFVLSAESMLLGTVGVIGATVGLTAVSSAVNDELTEVALAIRSIDQSFHYEGDSRCGACVAGSSYTQTPVEVTLKQLQADIDKAKEEEQKLQKQQQEQAKKPAQLESAPESALKTRAEKRRKNRKNRQRDLELELDDKESGSEPPPVSPPPAAGADNLPPQGETKPAEVPTTTSL